MPSCRFLSHRFSALVHSFIHAFILIFSKAHFADRPLSEKARERKRMRTAGACCSLTRPTVSDRRPSHLFFFFFLFLLFLFSLPARPPRRGGEGMEYRIKVAVSFLSRRCCCATPTGRADADRCWTDNHCSSATRRAGRCDGMKEWRAMAAARWLRLCVL